MNPLRVESNFSPSGKHGAFTEMLLEGLDPRRIAEGVVTSMNLKLFMEQELIQVPQKPLVSNGSREILLTSTPEKKHLLYSSNASSKTSNWVCRDILTGHGDRVTSVAISPDGKTLASAGEKQPIKLWRLNNGNVKTVLKGHSQNIYIVAFSPDANTLASGGADGTIRIWDLLTGEPTFTLGHSSCVYSLAFSPDGQRIVSGSEDKTIKVWELG